MEPIAPVSTTPDLYADGIRVGVGNYGVVLTLALSDPDAPGDSGAVVGRVRMSRHLARTLADILTEHLTKMDEIEVERDSPR